MNTVDLSLYFIVDPSLFPSPREALKRVDAAVQCGVTLVQLRSPSWKKRALFEFGLQLKPLLAGRVPFLINDHVDLALALKADGVHLGQDDLPLGFARNILGSQALIGLTANRPEHFVADYVALADYVGVGPVFPTTSKPDASAVLGVEGLKQRVSLAVRPVVAIGGIDVNNAALLAGSGVAGLAVISALSGESEPEDTCRRLLQAFYPVL